MYFFFVCFICFCNWISASTSENGCEREESTWGVNEWLAVCLMWRRIKEWGNGACQSFFPLPVRKVESVLCWQELADRCLLSALICRIQEQRRDYPGTASERFKQEFTDRRRSLNYYLDRYFIFFHYIFAHTLHLSFCMKVSPDLFITTSFGDFFFLFVCLNNYIVI